MVPPVEELFLLLCSPYIEFVEHWELRAKPLPHGLQSVCLMMIVRQLLQVHLNDQLFITDNIQPARIHLIHCGEVSLRMMGYYFCSETRVTIFDLYTCVHLEYIQGAEIRSCIRGQSITKPEHIQTPIQKQLHIIYQTKELTDRIDRLEEKTNQNHSRAPRTVENIWAISQP
jgi:hypothetical protein